MKLINRGLFFAFAILVVFVLSGCTNMRWGASYGMNVNFGPYGPRVTPTMNVGMYGGGRYY